MHNPTPGAENAPHHGGHGGGPSADLLGQMGYETRDVSLVALARWLLVFIAFIGGSTFISYLVFRYTVLIPLANEKRGLIAHVRNLPPFPQLQKDPKTDMMDYRNAEDQVLTGKGSGSTKPGVSIDDAINAEATQRGISGIKGDATPWNYSNAAPTDDPADKSYPGGGDYGSNAKTSDKAPTNSAAQASAPEPNLQQPGSVDLTTPPTSATSSTIEATPAPNGNGTTP